MFRSLLAAVSLLPFAAEAGTVRLAPLAPGGNADFAAASVNASGTVVGTLYTGGAPSGVAIAGGKVTALPAPAGPWDAFHPRRINRGGAILGWARRTTALAGSDMFLWRNGKFVPAYETAVVEPGGNASQDDPLPMALTDTGIVAFNVIVDISAPVGANYGRPGAYQQVPPLARYVHADGVNAHDTVAGIGYSQTGITAVFAGSGSTFTVLAPPNAVESTGGWINGAGTVAGSFKDGAGAWHGFLYAGSAYTVFDMPEPATLVTTDAINASGRVVGAYTDAAGRQHGFLYAGGTVTRFGSYPGSDALTLAIGDEGDILLARQIGGSGTNFLSFAGRCSGTAC